MDGLGHPLGHGLCRATTHRIRWSKGGRCRDGRVTMHRAVCANDAPRLSNSQLAVCHFSITMSLC